MTLLATGNGQLTEDIGVLQIPGGVWWEHAIGEFRLGHRFENRFELWIHVKDMIFTNESQRSTLSEIPSSFENFQIQKIATIEQKEQSQTSFIKA